MKKRILIAGLCVAILLCCGCKTQEQINNSQTAANSNYGIRDVIYNEAPEVQKNIIRVSGTGSVMLEAEIAKVCFRISATAQEAEAALMENERIMEEVYAALLADVILEEDMERASVSLWPQYVYAAEAAPYAVTGYSAQSSIQVTIRDLGAVGLVVMHAMEAGASSYDSLRYTLSDEQAAYQQALAAAVRNAQGKALAMAEAAGAKLVATPLSIEEQKDGDALLESEKAEEEAVTLLTLPASVQEIRVSASVQVEFEIVETK